MGSNSCFSVSDTTKLNLFEDFVFFLLNYAWVWVYGGVGCIGIWARYQSTSRLAHTRAGVCDCVQFHADTESFGIHPDLEV